MAGIDFKTLSDDNIKEFLDSFDTVLTDCDGKLILIIIILLINWVISINALKKNNRIYIMTLYNALYILGVLWMYMNPLPNAAEVLNTFQSLGKKVFYVTNNSTKAREEFVKKCKVLNFKATKDDILCTANLSACYLHDLGFDKKVYIVGSEGKNNVFYHIY